MQAFFFFLIYKFLFIYTIFVIKQLPKIRDNAQFNSSTYILQDLHYENMSNVTENKNGCKHFCKATL